MLEINFVAYMTQIQDDKGWKSALLKDAVETIGHDGSVRALQQRPGLTSVHISYPELKRLPQGGICRGSSQNQQGNFRILQHFAKPWPAPHIRYVEVLLRNFETFEGHGRIYRGIACVQVVCTQAVGRVSIQRGA